MPTSYFFAAELHRSEPQLPAKSRLKSQPLKKWYRRNRPQTSIPFNEIQFFPMRSFFLMQVSGLGRQDHPPAGGENIRIIGALGKPQFAFGGEEASGLKTLPERGGGLTE